MATFKVRRTLTAMGGVTIGSGTSTVFSGSTKIGTNGTNVTQILFGTVTGSVPAISAGSGVTVTGSFSIANAPLGAKVFMTPGAGASPGVHVYRASVCSAGNVSASFCNVQDSATGACDFAFNYLIIS